jgi:hypothetical protein
MPRGLATLLDEVFAQTAAAPDSIPPRYTATALEQATHWPTPYFCVWELVQRQLVKSLGSVVHSMSVIMTFSPPSGSLWTAMIQEEILLHPATWCNGGF